MENKILDLAGKVATRYKKRVWWVSHEDIRQEAVVAMCRAVMTYKPDYGVEKGAYLWQAAVNAARRYVLKSSAPVSASHRVDVLKGLLRADLALLEDAVDVEEGPDEKAHRVRLAQSVRQRVQYILGPEGAEFAIAVIGGTFTPQQVCEEHGLQPREVYAVIKASKGMLQADDVLRQIWREDE